MERKSFVQNCYFKIREDEKNLPIATISGDGGLVDIRLDNYAIVPREEYEMLKAYHREGCK